MNSSFGKAMATVVPPNIYILKGKYNLFKLLGERKNAFLASTSTCLLLKIDSSLVETILHNCHSLALAFPTRKLGFRSPFILTDPKRPTRLLSFFKYVLRNILWQSLDHLSQSALCSPSWTPALSKLNILSFMGMMVFGVTKNSTFFVSPLGPS